MKCKWMCLLAACLLLTGCGASEREGNSVKSDSLYVEKVALSVEFAAVGQDVMKGTVDVERIDAMFDKARSLGIMRFSEGGEWNRSIRRIFEEKTNWFW